MDKPIAGAHFTDAEVASMVRMLMRDQLDHEAVCQVARDRITSLSADNARLQAELEAAKEHGEQYRRNWISLQDATGEQCHMRALEWINAATARAEAAEKDRDAALSHAPAARGEAVSPEQIERLNAKFKIAALESRLAKAEAEKQSLEQAIADLAASQRETLLAFHTEQARLDWLIFHTEWTAEQRQKGPRVVIDEMRAAK